MIIHFLGGARTVTGSQYLLELNGKKILLDCGLYQGSWKESYERNRNFKFDVKELDLAILSHAHIDHSGNLPNLIKSGYKGQIYATPVTIDLSDLMLRDSGHIQEENAEYTNLKRARRGEEPIEPLYTVEDASLVKMHFSPLPYNTPMKMYDDLTVTLVEAGHILGSASIVLDIQENGRVFRFWFSGDIGRYELPLIRDPFMPQNVDFLLMESTYGDKSHADPDDAYTELCEVVSRTIKRGGKVIIPAFAVGRTQELVYNLNRMMTNGEVPRAPIFVDSPLAVGASEIFHKFNNYFDDETHEFVRTGRHPALSFDGLTYVKSVDESKSLNTRNEPMIILSASGMAETGRILHHIKNNIEDPRSTIVIVSWQAPGTLGRELADRIKEVEIFGDRYYRKADIATIGGFSAHAGQNMLTEYAKSCGERLKKIFLVHGEEKPAMKLTERMRQEGIKVPIEYPGLYSTAVI